MSAGRAWTAQAMADALNAPQEIAQQALEDAAGAGECVRVDSGGAVFFVAGRISDVLDALEIVPADQSDVDDLLQRVRPRGVTPTDLQLRMVRKRVRRALEGIRL